MKKVGINYRSKLGTTLVEGERLEIKIDRMTQNNEPIGDSAPLIYTPRKDGVIAAYDIRTDKWDIALNAMEKVNQTRGKISELGGMREAKKSIEKEAKEAVANGVIESKNELN
jgi:ribosomal protein S2